LAGFALLALAGAAWADPIPKAAAAASAAPNVPDGATLDSDQTTVTAILQASQSRGYSAIGDRLSDLQAIMDRAPVPFSQTEERGGVIYFRGLDLNDCLIGPMMILAARKSAHLPARNVNCIANPYPVAALMLGSYYDETRQPELALTVLDRGLAWAPIYPELNAEKGAALTLLHRWSETLETYSAGLSQAGPLIEPREKAQLLRGKGFALTELKRYDEAEQAYRESLKLDAKHGHAAEELAYIARVKAGGAPTTTDISSGLPSSAPK
jgi:tetratricopeptide (TPR) repeat protein